MEYKFIERHRQGIDPLGPEDVEPALILTRKQYEQPMYNS